MPNLAGRNTLDTTNTDGNCRYDAKALGGNPTRSPNVRIAGSLLETYDSTSILDNVIPKKINPLIPLPCQPGVRTIVSTVNTSVSINGKFPAVTGDQTSLGGTPRPLTGPFQHANIIIGSNL
tara:strand:- start:49 stop:414 length:366 start_codon:yes stop_codon:yes gene_type:complete